jgi:hypothetical protein
MHAATRILKPPRAPTAVDCGIPLDSQYFDESRVETLPALGAAALLARFELPPQYCGVLEYFSQFTDLFSHDPSEIETPGLQWQIRANGQPLAPYHQLTRIVNPWGFGSFQISLRLPESATVEMLVRRTLEEVTHTPGKTINVVGGRLLGRYWYNSAYGAQQ